MARYLFKYLLTSTVSVLGKWKPGTGFYKTCECIRTFHRKRNLFLNW